MKKLLLIFVSTICMALIAIVLGLLINQFLPIPWFQFSLGLGVCCLSFAILLLRIIKSPETVESKF